MDRRLAAIDAMYRLDRPEPEVLQDLIACVGGRFGAGGGHVGLLSQIDVRGRIEYRALVVTADPPDGILGAFRAALADMTPTDHERMFYAAPALQSLSTLITRRTLDAVRARGLTEFVGLNAPPGRGGGAAIGAVVAGRRRPGGGDVAYWQPVAEHLAASQRLRRRLARAPAARFRPDGRVVSADGVTRDRSALEQLRAMVRRREGVRAGRRSAPASLWPALVGGRWTILDEVDVDGRRHVVARRNPASSVRLHALTEREHEVVARARTGEANKAIAIDLGVSEATVSRALAVALRKLGANLSTLLAVDGAPTTTTAGGSLAVASIPRGFAGLASLSAAERDVLSLAVAGHSNDEIARARGRSVRTITNQLGSAYEKLGIHSRRELVIRWSAPPAP